ncbi:MAG: ATP-binding cassette domain-containing protein [Burkholderiales bacterium]|nr:ATP-binding cassette domain-containing protein [Burkholderiales bacterium]
MKLQTKQLSARHPAARAGTSAALRDASISIASGEQVAIIGPSGAGKTTLLSALACALQPTQGDVMIDGHDPWQLSRPQLQLLRGRLYLAPQVPPLPPRQRVVTSVLAGSLPAMGFWTSLRSLFYPQNISGAHAALEKFDLSEKIFDRVDRLSGGERQRVGLARALVSPATLWLVDEPLSALDPTRAKLVMDSLLAEARARGVTLVMTLHQVDVALARFERIIGLRDGLVAFDLPTRDVTPERLRQLYLQYEEELVGPATGNFAETSIDADKVPSVMHCR